MIGLIIIWSSCEQLLLVKWSIAPYVRAHRFKEPINTSQSRNTLCFTVLLHCVVVNVRLPGVSLSGVQNSAPVALSPTGTKIAIHYLRTRFSQGIEVSDSKQLFLFQWITMPQEPSSILQKRILQVIVRLLQHSVVQCITAQ